MGAGGCQGQVPEVGAWGGCRLGAGISKALGRWGQEFVTAGARDRMDKSPHGPSQHEGFSLPSPLTYAAPQWLFPNTCHGLG